MFLVFISLFVYASIMTEYRTKNKKQADVCFYFLYLSIRNPHKPKAADVSPYAFSPLRIATGRAHPADAFSTFTGKAMT